MKSLPHLQWLLTTYFLTPDTLGAKFVAWYGNGFDAYFIAAALVTCPDYVLRPYLTKNNALRGLRVMRRADADKKNAKAWEFLDGMAMLGLAGLKLAKFLDTFAPKYQKLVDAIDFDAEEFNPDNERHCEYAMRDSVGLYYAMVNAQNILMERFDEPLRVTMGGACIRIFQAHIPEGVKIPTPRPEVVDLVRDYVMRGGYCYCAKRYRGPVWKYDINQAYASAMREAKLPAGFTSHHEGMPPKGLVYIARVSASKPGNLIPFYCREDRAGRLKSSFPLERIEETWLTSIEVEQLKRERWKLTVHEAYAWDASFSMRDYVDKLERGRMTCEGGPSGPIGTVYKAVGNHSYGKTVEQTEPLEMVMAAECPPGYLPFHADGEADALPFVWFRWVEDEQEKAYHQPQLGAFITAHVRMVLRRAALLAPDAWLYADTDCVVFSRDVTAGLDIHPSRYGAWKVEEAGAVYEIIAKKVYTEVDAAKPDAKLKRSAKGLNVRKLSSDHFHGWFEGQPPVQEQIQRQNFLTVMQGAEMYRRQTRKGTAIEAKI